MFLFANRSHSISLAVILWIAGAIPLFGQLYHNIEILTRREGLSDNRVTCMFKDRVGYLWIGTKNGLNRYDGHDFTVFRPEHGNSISNEVINDITEDRDGKIWVATMEGLNCYDPLKKSWQLYSTGGTQPTGIPNPIVWSCFVDDANRVWISTDTQGPSALETDRKTFTHYAWKTFVKNTKPLLDGTYYSVTKMIPVGDVIYLGSTVGIFKFDKKTSLFHWLGEANKNSVLDMQYDADSQKMYMSTSAGELFCYDVGNQTYQRLYPNLLDFPSTLFFSAEDGHTWIGFPDGLLLADRVSNKVLLKEHLSTIPMGRVHTVYRDDRDIAWLATNNGLAKYDPNNQFSSFLPLTGIPDKPVPDLMGTAYYDETSDSYFVCDRESATVFVINRNNGKITAKQTDAHGKTFGKCHVVKSDREGQLWLLTDSRIYRYDREIREFILFPTPNGERVVLFRSMAQDDAGNYWFAGFYDAFYFYDSRKRAFTQPDVAVNGLIRITNLLFDDTDRSLWIGTFDSGLHRYDLSSKKIISYNGEVLEAFRSLNLIHDMYQDQNQRLWVATHTGGLFYYRPDKPYKEAFVQISMKEGLTSNRIDAVIGYDSLVWALSGKSIAMVDSRTGTYLRELGEHKILPFTDFSPEVHEPHYMGFDHKRKELLVAANGGLFLFKTLSNPVRYNFPVLLSSVAVDGHTLPDSVWKDAGSLNYRHPLKEIKLHFVALHYTLPSSMTYTYRLNGYDKEWKSTVNINEVAYQNLPPGNYTFEVRATDFAGHTSDVQAAFSFEVVPNFWQTWWFQLLVVSLVVLGVYLWIRKLNHKIWVEQKLNQFAISLYDKNTVDDILWDIAQNCISLLHFEDCVVYRVDEERGVLVQAAAAGQKKIEKEKRIFNQIEIPIGKGIVGTVAKTGKSEIIHDTGKDERYILDDAARDSEITVPIMVDGKVFGIIDSEHPRQHFYTGRHLEVLQKIAAICSHRLVKLLAEEKLRAAIARDLHDEIGSTLTSIHILSNVAMSRIPGPDRPYLSKINAYAGSMMENMSDIIWAINPQHDTLERLLLRMKEFSVDMLESAGITCSFKVDRQDDLYRLQSEERKFLYLIFKEALNNIVKYSKATVVSIVVEKKADLLCMIITDNGMGFDPETIHKGNGLKNMHTRAKAIGAGLTIQSGIGKGTRIILEKRITS